MKRVLFWIGELGIAAGLLYLTVCAGLKGAVAGIFICIWTMLSMGCQISIKKGGKKDD